MKRILRFALLIAALCCTAVLPARCGTSDNLPLGEPTGSEPAPTELAWTEPAATDPDRPKPADSSSIRIVISPAPRSVSATNKLSAPTPDSLPRTESAGRVSVQTASAQTQSAQVGSSQTASAQTESIDSSSVRITISGTSGISNAPDTPGPGIRSASAADSPVAAVSESPFSLRSDSISTPGKKPRFLPMRRRMDREINKIKYVRKGEIMFGLTASYGTLDSDDSDLWLVIDNINLNASVFTLNPFVGYFFRDNMAIGARFGYSQVSGNLASADLDLGETNDINFGVNDITLRNKDISFGIFLRSYAGLDPKGHFGLFGELEFSMSSGSSEFGYRTNGDLRQTFGDNTKFKISFNPGMAVYIFPNVCTTLSFGLGGLQYVKTTQKDGEGNKTGSRTYSNLRFRLNLADIRFGMTIHLWNKKKSL